MSLFKEMSETHCKGSLDIFEDFKRSNFDLQHVDLGLQISYDGRLWLCVNGVALIRFKPELAEVMSYED
jgi:hypothetical protein